MKENIPKFGYKKMVEGMSIGVFAGAMLHLILSAFSDNMGLIEGGVIAVTLIFYFWSVSIDEYKE